jgi:hypothetical protein
VDEPDVISLPSDYQISETVVTKTKVTHETKDTKTIFSQNVTRTKKVGKKDLKSPFTARNGDSPYTSPVVAVERVPISSKQVIVRPNK